MIIQIAFHCFFLAILFATLIILWYRATNGKLRGEEWCLIFIVMIVACGAFAFYSGVCAAIVQHIIVMG